MAPFKTCTLCETRWASRNAMMADPDVALLGYQAFSKDPVEGMLLFNHLTCRTTLAVKVRSFQDLRQDGGQTRTLAGTDACSGHCASTTNLETCTRPCRGAWVRQVLQTVKTWPKSARPAPV